jgi:hypothetical protein
VFQPKERVFRVDKTKYIRELEKLRVPTIRSLRPRGFGKSLWLDTLAKYYDIAYKDKFEDLFRHTDIGKSPTTLHSSFYVLKLDFGQLRQDTVDEFKKSFDNCLNDALRDFQRRYPHVDFKIYEQGVASFRSLTTHLATTKVCLIRNYAYYSSH